jgi:hypothetical protein
MCLIGADVAHGTRGYMSFAAIGETVNHWKQNGVVVLKLEIPTC